MTGEFHDHSTTQQWLNGVRIMHRAHIEAAKVFNRRHRQWGTTAALLGAVVATAIFTNLASTPVKWIQVMAGGVSLLAVAVTVVHTFLNYASLAASHQSASTGYGDVRREMELRILSKAVDIAFLEGVQKSWTRLDREAPPVPPKIYEWVSATILRGASEPKRGWQHLRFWS